eukprot:PITA_10957
MENLQNERTTVKGRTITAIEGILEEVTSLPTEGIKWAEKNMTPHEFVELFKNPRKELVRKGKGLCIVSLSEPWHALEKVIQKYITCDGRHDMGFFTVVFTSLEDKDKVFERGPYFYVVAGLYMQTWMMNFVLNRETLTSVLVWIRLYSLPLDYWLPESLKTIGNKLGHFLKISEVTLKGRYTSFARICVEMDLSGAISEVIILDLYDEEWVQNVDYEHIPFRCGKCHEHGHLYRDCPSINREGN